MSPVVILGAAAVVGSLVLAWWAVSGERSLAVTLDQRERSGADLRTLTLRQGASDRVAATAVERVGAWVRRRSPSGRIEALNQKLIRAGSPARWTVERVLLAKAIVAVAVALLMTFAFDVTTLGGAVMAVVGVVAGFYVPDLMLSRAADQRSQAIRSELSDVIDQLSMMTYAGLGIDAAIARAARSSAGPTAEELTRVGYDIRMGIDRSVALANLANRVDVPELNAFVAALAQSERLGVPVSNTLEIQSRELRLKRRQLAEEQAMKLPVKLLFPLVVCILPVLMIVIVVPAGLRILEVFE
jgi:tight adherence protein C